LEATTADRRVWAVIWFQDSTFVDSTVRNTYNLGHGIDLFGGQAMRYSRLLIILALLGLGFNAGYSLSPPPDKPKSEKPKTKKNKEGDPASYYKKWIDEDVTYIISDEERSVFKKLQNDEERDSFIDQFWARRNPDPRSSENSFKEEHYRRIAYANEHFASGVPGWRTDRGRIYIMYGKPDEQESHPTGGTYDRPMNEGGGTTSTYPFEKWWYRHIDGLSGAKDDIEIEFVDQSNSGEYKIAMSPDEKDALINVPNAGLTYAEQMGLAQKTDRVSYDMSNNNPDNPENMFARPKDNPFSRMEQYFDVQRPPQIKFDDLKSIVTTHVTFNSFPYDLRMDYMKLSADKILVPVTIELNNSDLEFKKETEYSRGAVNVYGVVRSLTGRIMYEWEDEIKVEYSDIYFEEGKNKRSEYQKIVSVPPGQRYRLDLVLKDVNSKNVGSLSQVLTVPKFEDTALQSSTIILANSIAPAPASSNQLQQYVIGDLKIVPNVKSEYVPGQNLLPYMQVYNMAIDQTTQNPSLDVTFAIKNGDKVVEELKASPFNSEQIFYGQRVVVLGKIPLNAISPGKYKLEIKVTDKISGKSVSTTTDFKVNPAVSVTTAKAQ
jgi:GWxTD domain-containing protein